jgi:hypothetical protein
MWFSKKSVIKPIPDNSCWGHLINDHKVDSATLCDYMRCVMKDGALNGEKVTLLRVFDTRKTEQEMITVTGWETFDQHPDLLAFEGYCSNYGLHTALERKNF